MTIEEVAKASGVIREEHLQGFLDYLVQLPEDPELLAEPHPTEPRLQGDVLQDQPFVLLDLTGQPRVRPMTVVLINNTCDLQPGRSSSVTYAAASGYTTFAAGMEARLGKAKARDYLASLRQNKIHELVYIGGSQVFPNGLVIHMDRMCTLDARLYEKALEAGLRAASFSQNGFYFFLIKLTRHLARMESGDVTR